MGYVVILSLKTADFLNWQDTNSYIIRKNFLIPSETTVVALGCSAQGTAPGFAIFPVVLFTSLTKCMVKNDVTVS